MLDEFGRNIEYLRLSVTENCNLRCLYCMAENQCIDRNNLDLKSYEKILNILINLGIKKIKITGGEPLVRNDIDDLILMLLKDERLENITITTNGLLVHRHWEILKKLDGINISLDTLNEEKYKEITRVGNLKDVMKNIKMIIDSGYENLKINAVIIKGFNDNEIIEFAKMALKYPIAIRFIELMPIGEAINFRGVKREKILEILSKEFGDYKLTKRNGNGPAEYIRFKCFAGDIGFIDAINHRFCHECNRIRMDSKGNIILCLHHSNFISSIDYLNGNIDEITFREMLQERIYHKPEKNVFSKMNLNKSMNKIGG